MNSYTILYVEDDIATQKVFSAILSNYFTHVISCSTSDEAMEIIKNSSFDMLITDINLPNANGLDLASEIKKKNPFIPIIIISACSDYEALSRAIEIGVDGYILKPISGTKFINKILQVIEKIRFIKKSRYNENLLLAYKEAIDRSSIVSKTNLKGKITYVNDSFCVISGYTQEELIGEPHNIVRHPDMPAMVFQEMWETIQAKKPWQGIIKNRKKDGSAYYVKSLVNPILTVDGEIEEYIAIRDDISELEMYKQNLEEKLQESTKEIVETQKEIIYTISTIGEKRSLETGLHVRRVAHYSFLLAKLYGLSDKEAELIKLASPMHDIGKIGIPDSVLNKPGPLDEQEWVIIKEHSAIGYEMLKHSKREILQAAAIIAYQHHERYDGLGYPQGLKGEEIHIFGRISALADVYDALGNDRVYKKKWGLEQILELFKEERGKQFDPTLIDLFLAHTKEFEKMKASLL